jgi:hypothetical protein
VSVLFFAGSGSGRGGPPHNTMRATQRVAPSYGIGGGGLGEGERAFALSPSPKDLCYAGSRWMRAPKADSFSTRRA